MFVIPEFKTAPPVKPKPFSILKLPKPLFNKYTYSPENLTFPLLFIYYITNSIAINNSIFII